jgi:hypothetical protein
VVSQKYRASPSTVLNLVSADPRGTIWAKLVPLDKLKKLYDFKLPRGTASQQLTRARGF